MDASAFARRFDGGSGGVDVLFRTAGESADDRTADFRGDGLDGFEIAGTADRKAGLDDIHIHAGQLAGDLHFFAQVHAGAGALFAVAQGGIENDDFV